MRGALVRKTWEADPALYAPARYRRPCDYESFVPDLLPLDDASVTFPGHLAGTIGEAEASIHALNKSAEPALAPLARLLLRTESIASSKVEGMQVDARSLARAEARVDTGQAVGPVVVEVMANVDAMQFAIEEATADESLTVDRLVEVHRVLLEHAHREIAGRVRSDQNWIGGNDFNPCGADFVPPPPEIVGGLLENLVAFCNEETLPPLAQAAVAHAQFETIHPFDDGNGRTGRALIHVILRRRGIAPSYVPPISVVFAADRDAYIGGLTAFRAGDETTFLEAFATATARSAVIAQQYVERVVQLQERWRGELQKRVDPRSDASAWTLIDVLPAQPVLSVATGVAATGRTKPSIGKGIAQLVEAGVLSPLSQGKRNRHWEATALLDLLVELEEGRFG